MSHSYLHAWIQKGLSRVATRAPVTPAQTPARQMDDGDVLAGFYDDFGDLNQNDLVGTRLHVLLIPERLHVSTSRTANGSG